MIQLNVISRITLEKNFFFDLLIALKEASIIVGDGLLQIRFVGEIQNEGIYFSLQRVAKLLGIADHVEFTGRSIPLEQFAGDISHEYFINFSVCDFIGYSGLECINLGFKTILYNIDENYKNNVSGNISFCADVKALVRLLIKLATNKSETDQAIINANQAIAASFVLTMKESNLLVSLLLPGVPVVSSADEKF